MVSTPVEDVEKFEIIIAHPEGFLNSTTGKVLLQCESFCNRVIALVADECHTVDLWYVDLI